MADTRTRIETKLEVNSYLQDLQYALSHNATITFQAERKVDQNRAPQYTNKFTVADLFPNEDPVIAYGVGQRPVLRSKTAAERSERPPVYYKKVVILL